jgi:hypothetical protein
VKYKTLPELAAIAVFVWVIVALVRSCKEDPTQTQLFTQLTIMRSDMQAIMRVGGKVTDYDNNRKTTFASAYLLLSVSADSWSDSLRRSYMETLLTRGWRQVKYSGGNLYFCKQGAYASLISPHENYGGAVSMVFSGVTINQCNKLLPGN